ncbi:hypothetical protein, conserved [Trypanosoma brucei gambiense DAL972]|uniref:PD-(D/E)XK endonuclease-like domain-containing protein n=1 Tax=Trypanosoma brucei gambiense (strain MHOM/CI/86/DAL972) TaxID=679716 RepID=D0A1N9_TRYB9|nr:hypothetical protein, conserved [Trypanosoma brucei gambiense DAL972]CBH15182.1 hypothetical protein, conserved [Trypanosoma brucei gambiense DAL972]|eukprot:XP_011777447.1 hypothetical protein, conserved [Trypanosoma brucei gambiense DAL972]
MSRVPHPSGVDILFDSKWHQYKIGNCALRSVSKLLDKHFPFDEKRALAAVAKKTGQTTEEVKASWNRQALLGKNIHEYIECKLRGLPPPTWTLLLKKKRRKEDVFRHQDIREGSKKKKKDKKGDGDSEGSEGSDGKKHASRGSKNLIDTLLHGEEEAYMVVADRVVETIECNYDIIAVEQVIASVPWGIAGTVDLIARNKRTGRLLIGDWKTSGTVASSFRFSPFETPCTGCLLHLPNSRFHRYAMQVAIYGEILKNDQYLEKGFFGKKIEPLNKDIGEINLSPAMVNEALEYGIVQMQKNDAGSVCVEFKEVKESTVMPVDATDCTFLQLLHSVMRG